MTDKDSWGRYEKLVLDRLQAHGQMLDAIYKEQIKLQVEMGIVKIKLAFIGGVSGMAGAIIVTVISHYLKN